MNKKILRTLTALCAALVLMGGFSVTAFAQTPEMCIRDRGNNGLVKAKYITFAIEADSLEIGRAHV